jgi:phosphoribosyl-AMP cyclohydrolase
LVAAVVNVQHSTHERGLSIIIRFIALAETGAKPDRETPMADQSLSPEEREQGARFAPKFDGAGLLTAVVTDAASGEVLVVAHMNQAALDATLSSGRVHFWSRSRQALWMKGETSGNVLEVAEMLVDCDQDALVIRARPAGPTCHTGARSCFYRRIEQGEGGAILVKVKT